MNMITSVLPWIQLGLAIILIGLVLLQRAADGIEGAMMGGNSSNMTYFARRGAERFLFIATIVVSVLFAGSALISFVV